MTQKNIHLYIMDSSPYNHQKNHSITRLAIFASGAGSNAQKIIEHFEADEAVKIEMIVSNKIGSGVIKIAEENDIPVLIIEKNRFFSGDGYADELHRHKIDFVVLAGFLWKIPEIIIEHFRNRIINIHPALLPKFGGKGMYGSKVHEAVIAAGEQHSGITIHYVDEKYDNGDIIFQATCPVLESDTAEILASKIHNLEHLHFPRVVEECIAKLPAK